LRAVKEFDVYDQVRVAEICLVLDAVVSKKFMELEFIKYIGLECPNTHLRSYYNKMEEFIRDEKLHIYFFQDNLVGSMLS
jgi:hypothetical protein